MTPVEQAQRKWEANTKPHPKNHIVRPVVRNNPIIFKEEFRQFDKAIALLNWNVDCIEILKLETLQPRHGGPTRLISFLKCIADEFQIPLWGHARLYELDPPFPEGDLLTKEKLYQFYEKHGFQLRKIDDDTSEISYAPRKSKPLLFLHEKSK
jgi:hypothetical protein